MRYFKILLLLVTFSAQSALADDVNVVVYSAFGNKANFVVEGRLLEKRPKFGPQADDSVGTNLLRNAYRFYNEGLEDESVTIEVERSKWKINSDDDGYFKLVTATPPGISSGWHKFTVSVGDKAQAEGNFLIAPIENTIGLISDFDDTLIVSEVASKKQLLRNSLLKNYLQRKPVPGVVKLYQKLTQQNLYPNLTPIFYLSASPRQLYDSIHAFLKHHKFPDGVILTKQLGGDSNDSVYDQVRYKTTRIEQVLKMYPGISFVLVGDDGERDPEIYNDIRKRFPTQVHDIWIRKVHPDDKRARYEGQKDLNEVLGGVSKS